MPPIDPSHSRPLDVHRWSNHPEVNALVGEVWERVFGGEDGPRPGPKPKARPRDMLKVILLDLYVAWTTDPELSVGVNLNLKKWVAGSRYNALHLSRAVPGQIHRLADAGLIDLSMGSYSGPGASTNRSARIRAAKPLRAMFREARFGRIDVGHAPDRECILLRDANGAELEYEVTLPPESGPPTGIVLSRNLEDQRMAGKRKKPAEWPSDDGQWPGPVWNGSKQESGNYGNKVSEKEFIGSNRVGKTSTPDSVRTDATIAAVARTRISSVPRW